MDADESRVLGSYFVSNYPPFMNWLPQNVPDAIVSLKQPFQEDTKLGIYVQIPFCRKRCHFCYFKIYTGANSLMVNSAIETTTQELKLYVDYPFLEHRRPNFIYFGGGTPSYLSSSQITFLFKNLQAILPWDEVEEIAFECEPGTLTEKKLRVIRDLGVTRLSLGIENFNDHILEINNRAHRSKEVFRAYDFARSLDFKQINVDLIAGMVGETEDNWKNCVEKVAALAPDSITIYQMEIPFNTILSKQIIQEGKPIEPVVDWHTKREWVNFAFSELANYGYMPSSGYTLIKDKKRGRFLYRDSLWHGSDLLGLGTSSFSYINGTHFQNHSEIEIYTKSIRENKLPIHRALLTTPEDRFIREFILQMKFGEVDSHYFKEKFSMDVQQYFSNELEKFEDQGMLTMQNGKIFLTLEGLLQVDGLLPEFFRYKTNQ